MWSPGAASDVRALQKVGTKVVLSPFSKKSLQHSIIFSYVILGQLASAAFASPCVSVFAYIAFERMSKLF